MLEGNPVVDGHRVVYDPQSPNAPKLFRDNGSQAEHLAIVCNGTEATHLTRKNDSVEAGRALLGEGAEVAVIKRGALGALIITAEGIETVPAFRSSVSTLIGSGDIFSALFAYHWIVNGLPPQGAAELASRSAAYYCASEVLPIPETLPPEAVSEPVLPSAEPSTVYLAAPFFTPSELHAVEEAKAHLEEQGLQVFSPFHVVGIGPDHVVARADLQGIEESDFVFALIDGQDPGTLFEIGFARALGKPVVAFASAVAAHHLTMVRGSGCEVFSNYVSAIYHAAWRKQMP
jgi:hypothetical protein